MAVGGEVHFQVWRFVDGERYDGAILDRIEVSDPSLVEITSGPGSAGGFALRGLRKGRVDVTVHDNMGRETSFELPIREPASVKVHSDCMGDDDGPFLAGMHGIWLFSYVVYDKFDRPLSAKGLFPFSVRPAGAMATTHLPKLNSQWQMLVTADVDGPAGQVEVVPSLPGAQELSYKVIDEGDIDAVDWDLTFERTDNYYRNHLHLLPTTDGKSICKYSALTAPEFRLASQTPEVCRLSIDQYRHQGNIDTFESGTCEMSYLLPEAMDGEGIEGAFTFEVSH